MEEMRKKIKSKEMETNKGPKEYDPKGLELFPYGKRCMITKN